MIDLKVLEQRGITPQSLEAALKGDPLGKAPERALIKPGIDLAPEQKDREMRVQSLINRIRSRIQEGMTRNLADFRTYYALDILWDTPFRQINPTLLQTFLESDPNDEKVYKAFQDWGLTNWIEEKKDPKTGKAVKSLNLPVFVNVIVPLVKAYVTIRWAKIMNDRRLTPFFKYEPVKLTGELTLKCDVLTDRVQVMAEQYGYFDVMKQAVLKMLHYSQCFQFPKEEWHYEEQVRKATPEDVRLGIKKTEEGDKVLAQEDDEITVTDREGLRYHLPHPTRTFYDLAHGPYTFNYDSGCEYAGYWRIARYREILDSTFWNKEQVALGSVDLVSGNRLFFTTVYTACTLTIPVVKPANTPSGGAAAASLGVGAGNLDREKEIATLYYGTEHGDQGVLVTEYFEKLIPSENGLGDYDKPVWFRFVVAGDGCTILYAAPLPYCPIIYYGYDADESRSKNASMSLEIAPFQDQFSNMLTQIILTAKQNLANVVFIDEDQVTETSKTFIQNIGEKFFRALNIISFSGKKAFKGQNRVVDAAHSVTFPKGNVAELINVLKTILDVLERVLVMSSQEVAQAASHEQTREEVKNIAGSTNTRVVFTAVPVDIARDAWKRQIYYALMAYGDDEFFVHVPTEVPLTDELLTALGFSVIEKPLAHPNDRWRRMKVKKHGLAVPLWELASNRDNEDRTNYEKIATLLATITDKLIANPMTAQAIGPDQAIELANQICYFAGLPRNVKLRNVGGAAPEQQQAAAQQQLQQVVQTVLQQVNQNLQTELKPLLDHAAQTAQATAQNSQDLSLVMPQIAQIMQALNIQVPHPANDNGNPTPAAQPRQ